MNGRFHAFGVVFHWFVAIAAVIALGISGYVFSILAFEPDRSERLTSGISPVQFFQLLSDDRLDSYGDVFAVAHNAGNGIDTVQTAIEHGADVIEIDVVMFDGGLYASHDTPRRWFSGYVFRGPTLEQAWDAAAKATAVEFDLKDSSSGYIERVIGFLIKHRGEQDVIVSSADPAVLRELAERVPEAYLVLSIKNQPRLSALLENPVWREGIDGISIRASLVNEDLIIWAHRERLFVMAWTVNDIRMANRLVGWGVDAITTDNLALMELLGGDDPGALRLDRYRSAAEPAKNKFEQATPANTGQNDPADSH